MLQTVVKKLLWLAVKAHESCGTMCSLTLLAGNSSFDIFRRADSTVSVVCLELSFLHEMLGYVSRDCKE